MAVHLLLYRLKRPVQESEAEIAKLRDHLPGAKPVFFGRDSGVLAFQTERSGKDLLAMLYDISRFPGIADWAYVTVGEMWACRDEHGPFHTFLRRHAPRPDVDGPD